LSRYGLTAADLDDTAVPIWPENLASVNALIAVSTHWRVGMNGVTGLDYNVLPAVFQMMQIPPDDWPDTFECLRILESEAMKVLNK
jgi:hypothetical protein